MTEIGMAISNPYLGERRAGHIGQALPGVEIRICNESDEIQTLDQPGEIQVKGSNVFKEYCEKPEATQKAFTKDGWFRTGDIAIMEASYYKILGRDSVDIIKSGGYKISALEINSLREAEKLMKRKELDLVAGTRYYEIVNNYFDVKNALAQLDYPQMVAYSQGSLHISQVVQTAAQVQGASTAQGNVSGYGVNVNGHGQTNVTLQEHSIVLPLMYITQDHTYQQGVNKAHTRRTKLDFFDPLQIGLGFQPIMKSEIYGHLTDAEARDI